MAILNLNDATPAAPAGKTNCLWQADTNAPRNVSVYMPLLVGDSGSGGASGAVPAPAAGDAAANKFLKASGTWAAVASILLQTNGTNNGSQTKLNLKAGSNVTLTDDGTGGVTIDSSAASATPVNETPAGPLNGSNVTFTLSNTPSPTASFQLYLNGVFQRPMTDYSLSGSTITYVVAPKASDAHTAAYTH